VCNARNIQTDTVPVLAICRYIHAVNAFLRSDRSTLGGSSSCCSCSWPWRSGGGDNAAAAAATTAITTIRHESVVVHWWPESERHGREQGIPYRQIRVQTRRKGQRKGKTIYWFKCLPVCYNLRLRCFVFYFAAVS